MMCVFFARLFLDHSFCLKESRSGDHTLESGTESASSCPLRYDDYRPVKHPALSRSSWALLPLCLQQGIRSGMFTVLSRVSGICHHPGLSPGGYGPWQLVNLQWGLKSKSVIELFCYLDWGLTHLWIWCRKWLRNPPWQALSLSRNHSNLTHLTIRSKSLYELEWGRSQCAHSVQPQETR